MATELTNMFFCAAFNGNTDLMEYYLEKGYNLNATNLDGRTALMLAAKHNTIRSLKFLTEKGADLNLLDYRGDNALRLAHKHEQIKTYLKSKGMKTIQNSRKNCSELTARAADGDLGPFKRRNIDLLDSQGLSALIRAIRMGRYETAHDLIDSGADVNQKDSVGRSPLIHAIIVKDYPLVQDFFNEGANTNLSDNYGNFPVAYAAGIDDIRIVKFLLNNGAKVNFVKGRGKTALISSVLADEKEITKFLLNRGADVNKFDSEGNTALCYAAFFGDIKMAKLLVEHGANVDLCGPKGRTPLAWAAGENKVNMVKFLVNSQADINFVDAHGNTALSYACQYNSFHAIQKLLEFNADCNKVGAGGVPPIKSVVKRKNVRLFHLLEENNVYLEDEIMEQIENHNGELAHFMLKNMQTMTLNKLTRIKSALLFKAVQAKNLNMVEMLVDLSTNVNKCDHPKKMTPLMYAVKTEAFEIVKYLTEKGANVNAVDVQLQSPLCKAIDRGNLEIFKFLIERGASVNQKDRNGESLLGFAARRENFIMVTILIDNGADIADCVGELERFCARNSYAAQYFSTAEYEFLNVETSNVSGCSNASGIEVTNTKITKPSENKESSETSDECVICFSEKINAVLYDCGHQMMCFECARKQWKRRNGGDCPVCRKPIKDVIKTFKS